MPRPLAVRRLAEIKDRIRSTGSVSVVEMAALFGVSRETVRRDLKLLAGRGEVEVVHGGAVRRDLTTGTPAPGTSADRLIDLARCAVGLVRDGDTVLLDCGGPTAGIAAALAARRGLTVCTHSLAHALVLARHDTTRVFVLGGEVEPETQAAFGVDTLRALEDYHCTVAFVAASGFTAAGEMTDVTRESAELRSRMFEVAERAYIVADQHALDRRTSIRVMNCGLAAGVLAPRQPAAGLAAAFAQRNLRLIVPSPG